MHLTHLAILPNLNLHSIIPNTNNIRLAQQKIPPLAFKPQLIRIENQSQINPDLSSLNPAVLDCEEARLE